MGKEVKKGKQQEAIALGSVEVRPVSRVHAAPAGKELRVIAGGREPRETSRIGDQLPEFLPPLHREFFAAMLRGERLLPTEQQITEAIEAQFTHAPLTYVAAEQEAFLRGDMRDELYHTFYESEQSKQWKALAGDVFYIPRSERTHPLRRLARFFSDEGLVSGEKAQAFARQFGISPLTAHEKEALLTDPAFYNSAEFMRDTELDSTTTGGLLGNGTRHLTNEQHGGTLLSDGNIRYSSYGFTVADFIGMLDQVRAAQGKRKDDRVVGLDIGGSNGRGAHDAELLDPNLAVTNITFTPELAVWPLRGGHQLLQAERLPASLGETVDLAFSHLAFRYMRYRSIALENVLRSLRVGGIADIHLSADWEPKPGQTEQEMDEDVMAQLQRMKELEERGIIQSLPMARGFFQTPTERIESWRERPALRIRVQKTASIPTTS